MEGKLKFYRESRAGEKLSGCGWGFIRTPDGDLFFHVYQWCGRTPVEKLRAGDPLQFEIGKNHRGKCAVKVRLAGDEII